MEEKKTGSVEEEKYKVTSKYDEIIADLEAIVGKLEGVLNEHSLERFIFTAEEGLRTVALNAFNGMVTVKGEFKKHLQFYINRRMAEEADNKEEK